MKKIILLIFLQAVLLFCGCAKQTPTRTPVPTASPVPTATPTSAPTPTVTPKPAVTYTGTAGVRRIDLVTADGRGVDTRDIWKGATLKVSSFDEETGEYTEEGSYNCEYKGRGNSTWNYNKKPFNIKFEEKTALLGMKKGKRFSFIANWLDRTAMRNCLTYSIANIFTELNYADDGEYLNTGWKWSPSAEYAEVYINGKYSGLFLVTESIRIADNRLELVEQNDEGTLPISERGLVFEMSIDGRTFETSKYLDRIANSKGFIPYNVKYPDYNKDMTAEERKYAREFIAGVEDIIFAPKSPEAWEKICETIDITSFADFWLVQAIAANAEPLHPKSVFMYKNNDSPDLDAPDADANKGKLYAGPVWDFDWDTYSVANSTKKFPENSIYYDALFQYNEFVDKVRERFELIREHLEKDIPELITETQKRISQSVANDDKLYPWIKRSGNRVNSDSLFAFSTSIFKLQSYLRLRVNAIEKQLTSR